MSAMAASFWDAPQPRRQPVRRIKERVAAAAPAVAEPATRAFGELGGLLERHFPELWSSLTEEGRRKLIAGLIVADTEEQFRRIIIGWHLTMVVRADDDYEQALAERGTGRPYTPDELKAELGL